MNFRIVESKYLEWDSISESFEEDYLYSTLTNEEIRQKYNMTHRELKGCCDIIKNKNNLHRRPFWKNREKSVKYYYKFRDGFIIQKRIDGVLVYFGFFHSLSVVNILIDLCESVDWNVDMCKYFCKNWRDYSEV